MQIHIASARPLVVLDRILTSKGTDDTCHKSVELGAPHWADPSRRDVLRWYEALGFLEVQTSQERPATHVDWWQRCLRNVVNLKQAQGTIKGRLTLTHRA